MTGIILYALTSIQPLMYPLATNPTDIPKGDVEFSVTPLFPVYGAMFFNSKANLLFHGGWISFPDILTIHWFGFGYWSKLGENGIYYSLNLLREQGKMGFLALPWDVDYIYTWDFSGEVIRVDDKGTAGLCIANTLVYLHPALWNISFLKFSERTMRVSAFYQFKQTKKSTFNMDIGVYGRVIYAGFGGSTGSRRIRLSVSMLIGMGEDRKVHISPLIRLWIR